jgi:hypothetical protein
MIAVQEQQSLPVTLYKNTHLLILIYKNIQAEMPFNKMTKCKLKNAPRREDGLTEPLVYGRTIMRFLRRRATMLARAALEREAS